MGHPSRLGWLDGLRGIAILLVIGVHVSIRRMDGVQAGLSETPFGFLSAFFDMGAYGVQLFYIVSGFTMAFIWFKEEEHPQKLKNFFIRRFFRIVPFYWLVILINTWNFYKDGMFDIYRFVFSMLYMTDITPYDNYGAGGNTLDMEITFYLLFPFLVALLHKKRTVVIALCASFAWMMLRDMGVVLKNIHFIAIQATFFVMGGYVYTVVRDNKFQKRLTNSYMLPIWVCIVVGSMLLLHASNPISFPLLSIIFGIFLLLANYSTSKIIDNYFLRMLGKYSFSLYIVHFSVLSAISYFVKVKGGGFYELYAYGGVLVLSLCVAKVTYHIFEKPSIAMGRKIIANAKHKKELKGI